MKQITLSRPKIGMSNALTHTVEKYRYSSKRSTFGMFCFLSGYP